MAKIKLNNESENDFLILFSLPEKKLIKIINLLKNVEPGDTPESISGKYSKQVNLSFEDFNKILSVIFGINQLKLTSGFEKDEIVNDLILSIREFDNEQFLCDHCEKYLSLIINLDSPILLTIVAKDLTYSREKIFGEGLIETDIRPIFEKENFKGLVIVHTLKIEYIENGKDEKTIYLAIDKEDIVKLEKQLQVAKERECSLKSNISSTFVDFLK